MKNKSIATAAKSEITSNVRLERIMKKLTVIPSLFVTVFVFVTLLIQAEQAGGAASRRSLDGRFGMGLQPGFWKARENKSGKTFAGFSVTYRLFPHISLDGDLDFTGERAKSIGRGQEKEELLDYDTNLFAVQVSIAWHFRPQKSIDPVVYAGPGYYYFDIEGEIEEAASPQEVKGSFWEPGIHGGIGVLFRVFNNWIFNIRTKFLAVEIDAEVDGARIEDDRWKGFQISLGFSRFF